MAYAQWIAIKIVSENMTLTVRNAKLDPGKFHRAGNKDAEIKPSEINGITIKSGEIGWIHSSGRQDSPTGTKGSIDLYHEETLVAVFNWNCPWGIRRNSFDLRLVASDEIYHKGLKGGNRGFGPIREVTLILVSNK
ncbi:hypothetical protein J2Y38_002186 [Flavobacterium sp. 2755]|uniref:aegerolysin family protein n=1 Tax=Flavobacterium sp. 2755 TaxID=2817765 RepID=UPI0028664710|nr:aegerolysin family protein [Flavobacterium sp. 2755]MDR6761975.1 hypothetical protein [Flavobacterium sp. 2755]